MTIDEMIAALNLIRTISGGGAEVMTLDAIGLMPMRNDCVRLRRKFTADKTTEQPVPFAEIDIR